jgi:hypothetical protein
MPTELISNVEKNINKRMVKLVAKELVDTLKKKVIKKTAKKPFLIFFKKSKKIKLKEVLMIFAIGIIFNFIKSGGQGGIRTLVTMLLVRSFSKRLVSASHPPNRIEFVLIYIIYFNDAKKTPFRFYLVDLNR